MALSSYCPTCKRVVYMAEDDTQICPVCSTPLLSEIPAHLELEGEQAPSAQ